MVGGGWWGVRVCGWVGGGVGGGGKVCWVVQTGAPAACRGGTVKGNSAAPLVHAKHCLPGRPAALPHSPTCPTLSSPTCAACSSTPGRASACTRCGPLQGRKGLEEQGSGEGAHFCSAGCLPEQRLNCRGPADKWGADGGHKQSGLEPGLARCARYCQLSRIQAHVASISRTLVAGCVHVTEARAGCRREPRRQAGPHLPLLQTAL